MSNGRCHAAKVCNGAKLANAHGLKLGNQVLYNVEENGFGEIHNGAAACAFTPKAGNDGLLGSAFGPNLVGNSFQLCQRVRAAKPFFNSGDFVEIGHALAAMSKAGD